MSDTDDTARRSQAVAAGMAAAAARGVKLGRPPKMPAAAARVSELRAQGLSLQQIADTLTADKVPTPGGRSDTWTKRSVQNVVAKLDA